MAKTIMKSSLLCLILLGLSCVALADVSPFYKVNTKVKGKKTNERRLVDLHGSEEQHSVMASIFNSRELGVGPRDVVIGSKGKPHLGERGKGKGKGGFKYKDRYTSSSSKSSKKGKGKGGKGKGGKGKGGSVGVIHNPGMIPTTPVVHPPVMPPIDISGDTPMDTVSGDTPMDTVSGDTPTATNPSPDTGNDGASGDTPIDGASRDTPVAGDTPSPDEPTGDIPNPDDPTGDTPTNDDPDGDSPPSADESGADNVLNFIMVCTDERL